MNRKRRIIYIVNPVGDLWWCPKSRKWVTLDALEFGGSNDRKLRTVVSAYREAERLIQLGAERVDVVRITWKRGKRRITEFRLEK